jgi:hypothetical protein
MIIERASRMASREKPAGRVSLTLLALISFVISFAIARIFTTIRRGIVLKVAGFHIHHFWYGAIIMAIGVWLAVAYKRERIVRPAVVLIGSGGGLIGDEVGLLLTGNYWTGITYTAVIFFLVFVSAGLLFKRYSRTISTEIKGFTISRAAFYFGIILATVSITFLTTRNPFLARVSAVTTIAACIMVVVYLVQRIRTRRVYTGKVDK